MENASKALIIAGAILISILLISVGIMIMNAISNPVQTGIGTGESTAIDMFNSNFTSYQGRMKGSTIRSTVISKINSSNATNEGHTVALTSSITDLDAVADIENNTDYTVEITYHDGTDDEAYTGANVLAGAATVDSEQGYIFEIRITGEA